MVVHEYGHIYQLSFLLENAFDQIGDGEGDMACWLLEGFVEYYALRFAAHKGSIIFDDRMRELLEEILYLPNKELSYSETYDGFNNALSVWAVAYLVYRSGMNILYRDFTILAYEIGWKNAFNELFGMSVEDFYIAYSHFLTLSVDEKLAILPTHINLNNTLCSP